MLRAFADNKFNIHNVMCFVVGTTENIAGKRKLCRLQAISPFPTFFNLYQITKFLVLSNLKRFVYDKSKRKICFSKSRKHTG